MGSLDRPVRLDPFQRIIEVGWRIAGWGVLTVDYPQGQQITLDSHSAWSPIAQQGIAVTTGGVIDKEALANDPNPDAAIWPATFDHVLNMGTLYSVPVTGYSYQTVGSASVPAGADATALINDMLEDFPGANVKMCSGSEPGPDPPYGGGLITMEELILPDCSGVPRPGQDIYMLYYGPTPLSDAATRIATRKVWLIDFTRWRTGETVEIRNADTGPDEHLPSYDTTVTLKRYPRAAILTGASNTITGLPAGSTTTIVSPYTSASLGFVSRGGLAH